jgi:hypothetical protein
MRTSSLLALASLAGASVLGLAIAPGCSSSSSTTTPPTTSTYTPVVPNARPTATPTGGSEKWVAVNSLLLGLTTKGSNPPASNANAWKDYGFDLDNRNTTADDSKTSNNSCTRVPGSPSGVLTDGNGGRDNNFGSRVMQTIKSLKSDAEDSVNSSIQKGSFSLILHLKNYTDADNASVPGEVFVGNHFGNPTGTGTDANPTFSASDKWPIVPSSLKDGATLASGAKLQFPTGYMSGGYWVSGDFGTGTINLDISLSGADISLPIDSGIISFKVADGSDGTIAGAMDVGKLQDALTPVAKKFGICPGNSTFDQVVQTLTQGADLKTGAANLNQVGVQCDAISIALGFTVKPTGIPDTVLPPPGPPGPDDCSGGDAGADGATGG